uniref:ribosomal oxygenase 2 n=1 Tax=Ciona intestinalis TaxID=7719 RepID=UPI0000523E0E|nr:ribosomal oxygenase 2 [Ciona intestinalis]|eukprot:XP_002131324.1 ribosomal oxygenase 2 [Ciona intestinalis]
MPRFKKTNKSLLKTIPMDEVALDLSSPDSLFQSLIQHSCSIERFYEYYWEQRHLYIPCLKSGSGDNCQDKRLPGTRSSYFNKLFNHEILKEVVLSKKLKYDKDICACRFDDEKKCRVNAEVHGPVTAEKVHSLFHDDKMTLQFHQPQRFHDELWKIQEKLESFFGSQVGSNVYMTPDGSQGLAPHHDNVEVFILQLEGEKEWKLYSPVVNLPRNSSSDFDDSTVKGLTLLDTIIMKPGDVLYFPRGTVHQAKSIKGTGHSTHLTISTYETQCWGDYILDFIPYLTDAAADKVVSLRRGLPRKYYNQTSTDGFKQNLKKALISLAESLTESTDVEMSDSIVCNFFANRLPPFGSVQEQLGKNPTLSSMVRLSYPDHVLISRGKGQYHAEDTLEEDDNDLESDEEGDKEDSEKMEVYVYYSTRNRRITHMMEEEEKPKGLRFAAECWGGLTTLKKSESDFVKVSDLNLPMHVGLDMLVALWAEGLLECKNDN